MSVGVGLRATEAARLERFGWLGIES